MGTLPHCLKFSVLLRLGGLGHLLTATLLFMTDNKIVIYLLLQGSHAAFPHDFLYLVIAFLLPIKGPLFPEVISVLNISVYQIGKKKVNNSQLLKKNILFSTDL